MKKRKEKIEIEIKRLEEIATYYEFPLAVFFMPIGFLKHTRCKYLEKQYREAFRKIKDITGEILE